MINNNNNMLGGSRFISSAMEDNESQCLELNEFTLVSEKWYKLVDNSQCC